MHPDISLLFFLDIFYKRYPTIIDGGFHYVDARDVGKMVISSFLKGRVGESYILSENFYSMKKIKEVVSKRVDNLFINAPSKE